MKVKIVLSSFKEYHILGEYVDLLICPYKNETLLTLSVRVGNETTETIKEYIDEEAKVPVTYEPKRMEEGPGTVLPPIPSGEETPS